MRRLENYLVLVLFLAGQAASQPLSKAVDSAAKAQARAEAAANGSALGRGSAPEEKDVLCGQVGTPQCGQMGRGGGFPVTGAVSGSWFDLSHDGEGWKIEIINATTAVVYWFTYPPPGFSTKQAWIIGVGRIEGDKIIVDDALIPSGATFGPDFDPDDVDRVPWGSFEFTFSGPNAGSMDYQGPAGFGSGSFNIIRLTSIANLPEKGVLFENVGPGISGSWFDPTHDGEGWIIEVIDAVTAVIYWFTYNDVGDQAWNIGIGQLKGNQIVVKEPLETEGTVFGATFDPDNVLRSKWGGYVFAFDGCNSGVMSYGNQKGLGFNKFKVERLTSLLDVPCTPFDPSAPPINTLATNAADALLLSSLRQDGHETGFFGTKSASGAPESLAAMKLMDPSGKEGDMLTDSDGMPSQITDAEEGDTVGIDQTGDPDSAIFFGLSKDGDLQSLIAIALQNLSGGGKRIVDKTVRDAPTRSGRATGWVSPVPQADDSFHKGANQSIVNVTQCGVSLDNAIVEAHVFAGSGSASIGRPLPGIPLGQGQYQIQVPNSSTAATVSPASSCRQFVDTTEGSCDFVDRIDAVDIPEICLLIGSAMVENTSDPGDLLAAVDFLESCAFGLYATKLSCESAGGSAFIAGQSRDSFVCDDIGQQDNSLINLLPGDTSNIRFDVAVKLPGRGEVPLDSETSGATAPINGPYPDFFIDLQDDVTITDFFTVPADAAAAQNYTATARIACAPQNTQVTMSITGTDGFMDSTQCTINGSGDCNLGVPVSTLGVRDTIIVTVVNGPTRRIQIISFADGFGNENVLPSVTVTGVANSLIEDEGTVVLSGVTISAADTDGTIAAVVVKSLDLSIVTIDSVDDSDPAMVMVAVTTVADAFGTATLEVVATDDLGGTSAAATFNVVVDAVNDPPTITVLGGFDYNGGVPIFAGPNCTQALAPGCGDQIYPSDVGMFRADYLGWVVQVTPGPANESAQATTVSIGAPSDPGLFMGAAFEPQLVDRGGTWDLNYGLGGDSGTATMVISVDDGEAVNSLTTLGFDIVVDNGPPSVTAGQSFSIPENSPNAGVGTVVGTDPEMDALQDWTIVSGNIDVDLDTNPAFFINPASGVLSVNDADDLDFEDTPSFDLSVTVSDGNATSAPQNVTVDLTDVNDNAPVVTKGLVFQIAENSSICNPKCRLTATDADTVGSLTGWSIVSGNVDVDNDMNLPFIISDDIADGEISVNDVGDLDFERMPSFPLMVTVGDGVNTSAQELVTIDLLNVND